MGELAMLADADSDIMDKDGDDGEVKLVNASMDVAENGYVLVLQFDDDTNLQYIAETIDEVFDLIRSHN